MFSKKRGSKSTRRKRPARRGEVEHLELRLMLAADPAVLLADVNLQSGGTASGEIALAGGKIFFAGNDRLVGESDNINENELFVIEGENPPRLVKDINPGFIGSGLGNFLDVGGLLYFTADDGVHGRELWVSDGTAAGTQMVQDIFPGETEFSGPNSSDPFNLTVVPTLDGPQLFFTANDGVRGRELWTADVGGASIVFDIYPGEDGDGVPNSSDPSSLAVVNAHMRQDHPEQEPYLVPPQLFYAATSGFSGRELWKTDFVGGGTQTRLMSNIHEDLIGQAPKSSSPSGLTVYKNEIYFNALDGEYRDLLDEDGNVTERNHLDSFGRELWKSDGTVLGTKLVMDILPGLIVGGPQDGQPFSGGPGNFVVHKNNLYFSANGGDGAELWKLNRTNDETTLGQVIDIRPGTNSSGPREFVSTNGFLFFKATTAGEGTELWRTDGTEDGTEITRDIRPGTQTPFVFSFGMLKFGDKVIFSADDTMTVVGHTTGFGAEPWISDGTLAGTHRIKETIGGFNSNIVPRNFTMVGSQVYFNAAHNLWRTDGTALGTLEIDIPSIVTEDSAPSGFGFVKGSVLFRANDGIHGDELWKTDGSSAGTVLLRDIEPGRTPFMTGSSFSTPNSGSPEQMTTIGDTAFFVASSAQGELWKTDGTTEGTVVVKDIFPDDDARPYDLVNFGGKLYFFATAPDSGTELWVSDGTSDGTHVVIDILQIPDFLAFPAELTVAGDKMYFSHDDGDGFELWVSDGTAEGTTKLDLNPDASGDPGSFVAVGSNVYFVADDGVHGRELWISDGTPDGTRMVRDIHVVPPGEFSNAAVTPLGVVGNTLYFFAATGDFFETQALWKSDGTFDGTTPVKDIFPGGREFFPIEGPFVLPGATIGNLLYFCAEDGEHGLELWVTDGTTDGTQLFKDLIPGPEGSGVQDLLAVGESLFFTAFSETFGRELWVSDGTPDGTHVHTFIDTVTGIGSNPHNLAAFGGTLYFVANDYLHGGEVWTTRRRLKADDPLFEILARDLAYRDTINNRPVESPDDLLKVDDEFPLEILGYTSDFVFTIDLVIHDADTGFDAYGLIGDNFDPILVVRGSEDLLDFLSDALPNGVGADQFAENFGQIMFWLDAVSTPGHPVSITGHSLGGALTQLIAAAYTDLGKPLGQVVTFNAPAISAAMADKFEPSLAERVMHYVTNGDPVSLAGEQFITGNWRRSTFSDLRIDHNHTLPVLVPFVSTDDPATSGFEIKERPDGITVEDDLPLDWLNSPFYFHTDADYLLALAAGTFLTRTVPALQSFSDIPPALLFRTTTEAQRVRIGNAIVQVQNAIDAVIDTLTLNTPGLSIAFPDLELNFFDQLTVQATDLSATFIAQPEPQLQVRGQVVLPQIYNATADFSGDNYIGVSQDGFDFVGRLSVEDIPLVPGVWEIQEIFAEFDTTTEGLTLDVGGSLQIPTGIVIGAELGFSDGQFNFISLEADELNRPFGATGIFLQRIAGQVDNVAENDPDPIAFGGGIGATGGPTITINLPDWAGGTFSGKLIGLDVDAVIDREHLTGSGELSIINGLAVSDGTAELNWTDGFLAAQGNLNVLDGLITATASFRADSALNINLFANATFGVPDVVPFIGGTSGLSGKFALNYINDFTFSNDYVAAWTTVPVPVIGPTVLGFRVFLNGGFEVLGGDEVDSIEQQTQPAVMEGAPREAAVLSISDSIFPIATGTSWVFFSAEWDNASPGTGIVLTTPGGQVLTEADIAARSDMAIVTPLSSATRRVVVVSSPAAGNWTVSVNDNAGLVNLRFNALVATAAPTVEIAGVSGGAGHTPVPIAFDAFDGDSTATVSLFYDTDNTGFDGVQIASGLIESDGRQTFTWNTTGIANGSYFIYALIDDGQHAPVFAYSASAVTIDDSDPPDDPDPVIPTIRFRRVYNPQAAFHFFTTSAGEASILINQFGFHDETTGRAGFAVVESEVTGVLPLHRLYNPVAGNHYYTYADGERDSLVALGWRFERNEGFIYPTTVPGTAEVFRLYNRISGGHLFTENVGTRDAVLALPGWEQHSSLGFAFAVVPAATATRAATVAPVLRATELEATTGTAHTNSLLVPVSSTALPDDDILRGDSASMIADRGSLHAQFNPEQLPFMNLPDASARHRIRRPLATYRPTVDTPADFDRFWNAVGSEMLRGSFSSWEESYQAQ